MKHLLIFFIFCTSLAHAGESLALLYGYGSLADGDKQSENVEPTGPAYKLLLGVRGNKIFELSFLLRYADLSDKTTFQGVDADLSHKQVSYGLQLGAWVFPWLQPHVGYARHVYEEDMTGQFSIPQHQQINITYNLKAKTTSGLYGGVDFGIISSKYVQLFANYDYYHFNGENDHTWEVMAGIRFFLGGSTPKNTKSSDPFSGSFFNSIFNSLL